MLDEYSTPKLSATQINQMCDGTWKYPFKNGTASALSKPLIIICGNKHPAKVYPNAFEFLEARFNVIEVSPELLHACNPSLKNNSEENSKPIDTSHRKPLPAQSDPKPSNTTTSKPKFIYPDSWVDKKNTKPLVEYQPPRQIQPTETPSESSIPSINASEVYDQEEEQEENWKEKYDREQEE